MFDFWPVWIHSTSVLLVSLSDLRQIYNYVHECWFVYFSLLYLFYSNFHLHYSTILFCSISSLGFYSSIYIYYYFVINSLSTSYHSLRTSQTMPTHISKNTHSNHTFAFQHSFVMFSSYFSFARLVFLLSNNFKHFLLRQFHFRFSSKVICAYFIYIFFTPFLCLNSLRWPLRHSPLYVINIQFKCVEAVIRRHTLFCPFFWSLLLSFRDLHNTSSFVYVYSMHISSIASGCHNWVSILMLIWCWILYLLNFLFHFF